MEENKFQEIAKKSKNASKKVATLSNELKNKALLNIASKLKVNQDKIFAANKKIFKYKSNKNNIIIQTIKTVPLTQRKILPILNELKQNLFYICYIYVYKYIRATEAPYPCKIQPFFK